LGKTFRRDFRAHLDDLEEMREFVESSVRACGLGSAATDDIRLCVDEAATNVIEYGYAGATGNLSIEIFREEDHVVVRMIDDASSFDPNSVASPDLAIPLHERPIGGMGVHLIKTLTDGLSHNLRPGGGNELVLRKRIGG
jgi:anti-sigma regulatory factor (Ser/Thr protein kinase)